MKCNACKYTVDVQSINTEIHISNWILYIYDMDLSKCSQLPYEYRNPLEKTNALSISFSRSDSDKLRRWWCMVNAWCLLTHMLLSPCNELFCRRNTTGGDDDAPSSMSIECVGRMWLALAVTVTLSAAAFGRCCDGLQRLYAATISIEFDSFVFDDASELNNSVVDVVYAVYEWLFARMCECVLR